MLFADLDVKKAGRPYARMSPAKFMYQSPPQTTTEVALRRGPRSDLYIVLATADPQTKRATFNFHVNPFVSWIWVGLLILISGCLVSLWPEVGLEQRSTWRYGRAALAGATGIFLTILLSMSVARPFGTGWMPETSPADLASTTAESTAP